MQLREHAAALVRFWPLLVALPLIAGALSLAAELRRPPQYAASARLMVSQPAVAPGAQASFPDFNLNYAWNTSTYILDDLPQIVSSALFAQDVSAILAAEGRSLDPAAVRGAIGAAVFHRSVTLTATAGDPETAQALVRGAIGAIETYGLKYWDRAAPAGGGLDVAVIDPPSGGAPTASLRALALDVGLRAGLALVAALGLALLAIYLDDRLRSPAQAEEWTGVGVIGRIPKE